MTGATVISGDIGKRLDQVTLTDLGRARRVVATRDDTTIIEGSGEHAAIAGRLEQIKSQIDHTTSHYDRDNCANGWRA